MTNPKHGIASRQWLDSFQKRSLTKEIFAALQSAAEEGWKAGMEEAARECDEHEVSILCQPRDGWTTEHVEELMNSISTTLAENIRSKITDSTPTPCRGK